MHHVDLDRAPLEVDEELLASLERAVRVLRNKESLSLLREHRRALGRHGVAIDERFIADGERRARELALAHASRGVRPTVTGLAWLDAIVELVSAMRGQEEANKLVAMASRVLEEPSTRRARARQLLGELDVSKKEIARDLLEARHLPGRRRHKRVASLLDDVLGVTSRRSGRRASELLQEELRASSPKSLEAWAELIERVAIDATHEAPIGARQLERLELLAELVLAFPFGDKVSAGSIGELEESGVLRSRRSALSEIAHVGLTFRDALELSKLKMTGGERRVIGGLVASGLEVELVSSAKRHVHKLAELHDARAARVYARWVTELEDHYTKLGVPFELSPEHFIYLPRGREELGVLALCLLNRPTLDKETSPDEKSAGSPRARAVTDPLAALDATLRFFQQRAMSGSSRTRPHLDKLLARLRASSEDSRHKDPNIAGALGDAALLDQLHRVSALSQEPAIVRGIRNVLDFEPSRERERAFLEALVSRTQPQELRLAHLRHSAAASDEVRQRILQRRVRERIEQLYPVAYQRELDLMLRVVVREVFRLDLPRITSTWRDALRYWLHADDNRRSLSRLLRHQATTPSATIKRQSPKNQAWIERARARGLDTEAWLAPREREVLIRGERFVMTVEADPLEVLRMGIPFNTCLSLDGGVNAASTIYNAIDANKQVIYVRNEKGNIVARKLLAISRDLRLIGYQLYVSARGDVMEGIVDAVFELCSEISREVGAPLAAAGEPERIHGGFWYDDGAIAFGGAGLVGDYCRARGLTPPTTSWPSLTNEARSWQAMTTGDVEAARRSLDGWSGSPANHAVADWLVSKVGRQRAERFTEDDPSVVLALGRASLDEAQRVRAIELGASLYHSDRLEGLLASTPPSERVARALIELASRDTRRKRINVHGFAHFTLKRLPALLPHDVPAALDLLDEIAPVWAEVRDRISGSEAIEAAVAASAAAVERAYDLASPSEKAAWERVIIRALMSRHRSVEARRAALRVVARHELRDRDEVERALSRLVTLCPALRAHPDHFAALLRQLKPQRVARDVIRRVGRLSAPPFEALGDLLIRYADDEGLDEALRPFTHASVDTWRPSAWELAWRRRRPRDRERPLRDALIARASETPAIATPAMVRLAELGDVDGLHRAATAVAPEIPWGASPKPRTGTAPPAPRGTPAEWQVVARRSARQVESARSPEAFEAALEDRSPLEDAERAEATPCLPDVGYATMALCRLLQDDASAHSSDAPARRACARIVSHATTSFMFDWERVLLALARRDDVESVVDILERSPRVLGPSVVVELWSLGEPKSGDSADRNDARAKVHSILVRCLCHVRPGFIDRATCVQRLAESRGLKAAGLLEMCALEVVELDVKQAIATVSPHELSVILRAIVAKASPRRVAAVYFKLEDVLSVSLFLQELEQLPNGRVQEVAQAIESAAPPKPGGRDRALLSWSRGVAARVSSQAALLCTPESSIEVE